jgi:hypothetical protein
VFKDPTIPFVSSKSTQWADPNFHKLVCTKLFPVIRMLELGINVILSDADIVFLKDPVPFFRRDLSLTFSIGSCHRELKDNTPVDGLAKLNTGFYWAQATTGVVHLFRRALKVCRTSSLTGDQPALNTILEQDRGGNVHHNPSARGKAIGMSSLAPGETQPPFSIGSNGDSSDAKKNGAPRGRANDEQQVPKSDEDPLANAMANPVGEGADGQPAEEGGGGRRGGKGEKKEGKNGKGGGKSKKDKGIDPKEYSYGFFDGCLFANGCIYFKHLCQNATYPPSQVAKGLTPPFRRNDPVMVHANFLVGKKEKLKHLQKYDLWDAQCIAGWHHGQP